MLLIIAVKLDSGDASSLHLLEVLKQNRKARKQAMEGRGNSIECSKERQEIGKVINVY